MIWPFRSRPAPKPSQAALEHLHEGARELEEAKALRRESTVIGDALRRTQEENHIAAALAAAITGRKTA